MADMAARLAVPGDREASTGITKLSQNALHPVSHEAGCGAFWAASIPASITLDQWGVFCTSLFHFRS